MKYLEEALNYGKETQNNNSQIIGNVKGILSLIHYDQGNYEESINMG